MARIIEGRRWPDISSLSSWSHWGLIPNERAIMEHLGWFIAHSHYSEPDDRDWRGFMTEIGAEFALPKLAGN